MGDMHVACQKACPSFGVAECRLDRCRQRYSCRRLTSPSCKVNSMPLLQTSMKPMGDTHVACQKACPSVCAAACMQARQVQAEVQLQEANQLKLQDKQHRSAADQPKSQRVTCVWPVKRECPSVGAAVCRPDRCRQRNSCRRSTSSSFKTSSTNLLQISPEAGG